MGQIWTGGANLDSRFSLKNVLDLIFLSNTNVLQFFFHKFNLPYDISRVHVKIGGANIGQTF